MKATKDSQVFLRDLPTHTPSPLPSLTGNLICPKIRTLGRNYRRGQSGCSHNECIQRRGSCDDFDWLWYTSVCKRAEDAAEDCANGANCSPEAVGSFQGDPSLAGMPAG